MYGQRGRSAAPLPVGSGITVAVATARVKADPVAGGRALALGWWHDRPHASHTQQRPLPVRRRTILSALRPCRAGWALLVQALRCALQDGRSRLDPGRSPAHARGTSGGGDATLMIIWDGCPAPRSPAPGPY